MRALPCVVGGDAPPHAESHAPPQVGYGTVEVITGPCDTLHELKEVHERAVSRLVRAAAELDMHVLGFGIQFVAAVGGVLVMGAP